MQGHFATGQNFVSPDDAGRFEIVGFHNWLCGVASGARTIQIQFKSSLTGSTMNVRGRSLAVNYAK